MRHFDCQFHTTLVDFSSGRLSQLQPLVQLSSFVLVSCTRSFLIHGRVDDQVRGGIGIHHHSCNIAVESGSSDVTKYRLDLQLSALVSFHPQIYLPMGLPQNLVDLEELSSSSLHIIDCPSCRNELPMSNCRTDEITPRNIIWF